MKVYERHFTDRKRDDNPCVVNSMPEQCILRHVRHWENGSSLEKKRWTSKWKITSNNLFQWKLFWNIKDLSESINLNI